jgi:GT2 family glycosyltransferase
MMMRPFSVLIPTWRNLSYLDLCVRGILRNSAVRHEIIIFFNAFDEDCRAWLEGRDVKWASSEENLGVCGAVNRAAELATTDHICYMNDDMYPLPGWDTALAARLGTADPLWLSGTAVEAGNATPCYIGHRDFGSTPATFREQELLEALPDLARSYDTVSTWPPTLLSLRDWRAIGGFDETYFPGFGSDPDLAMKMYAHGCRHFIGVGNSLVYHFSKATTGRFDGSGDFDPSDYFRTKWGMSRSRFLRRVIRRDSRLVQF